MIIIGRGKKAKMGTVAGGRVIGLGENGRVRKTRGGIVLEGTTGEIEAGRLLLAIRND